MHFLWLFTKPKYLPTLHKSSAQHLLRMKMQLYKRNIFILSTQKCTSYSAPQSGQADDFVSFLQQNEKYNPNSCGVVWTLCCITSHTISATCWLLSVMRYQDIIPGYNSGYQEHGLWAVTQILPLPEVQGIFLINLSKSVYTYDASWACEMWILF